jgi:predicted metallopeptidase
VTFEEYEAQAQQLFQEHEERVGVIHQERDHAERKASAALRASRSEFERSEARLWREFRRAQAADGGGK